MRRMNEDKNTLIRSYILGELSSEELSLFEHQLNTSPIFAEEVRKQKTEWEMQELMAENLLRKQIEAKYENLPQVIEKPKSNYKLIGIILSLLILGGLVYFLIKPPNKQPEIVPESQESEINEPEQTQPIITPNIEESDRIEEVEPTLSPSKEVIQYAVENVKPNLRSLAISLYAIPAGLIGTRGEDEEDVLSKATGAFELTNYQEVLDLLTNLPEDENQEALLLRAHANFNLDLYEAASLDFKALEDGGIYRREAQWFGLLSEMAIDKESNEIWEPKLLQILETPTHQYIEQARTLQSSLND